MIGQPRSTPHPRWGVVANGAFRAIPHGPLIAAGWVQPPFWMVRETDGSVFFIVEEPDTHAKD